MAEAPKHRHNAARNIFVERHGVTQPAPAPRFSRTPSAIRDAEKADIGELTSAWKAGR
jgi:alpha-methylacyl-CoA racemase